MTAGTPGGYTDLCGTLFRFPGNDPSDLRADFDDDTTGDIKSRLKSRYIDNEADLTVGDSLFQNRWSIADFREKYPDYADAASLSQISMEFSMSEPFNALTEHCTMWNIFTMKAKSGARRSVREWKGLVTGKIACKDDMLRDFDANFI